MNRIAALLFSASIAASASAAPQVDVAALKTYLTNALAQCQDNKIVLERDDQPGPTGFVKFTVTQTSTDTTCGRHTSVLYSPSTHQVLIGSVVPLPSDGRSIELRTAQAVSDRLQVPTQAKLARTFPLPDALKPITITKATNQGPFSYHGFVDASEQYLIVGSRGNLQTDPTKTLVDALGLGGAVRRGNPKSNVKVVELSDFECPTCGRAHKVVEPIIENNLGRVDYYRIDLPLFEMHEWSLDAAMGARAIQRVAPKKYWEYVDFVFGNQEQIGKMQFDTVLKNFTEDNDINWAPVQKIYKDPAERTALVEQVSRLVDLGINSTPTYIVNGHILGYGPDGKHTIGELKKAIGVK